MGYTFVKVADHQSPSFMESSVELDASQLYADKTWVELSGSLSSAEQRQILESARHYAQTLALPDVNCTLETIATGGVLQLRRHKALVVCADLDPYQFEGIITLHSFGNTSVLSLYKQLLGAEFFAVHHSAEARRRSVIQHLGAPEAVAFFFVVDRLIDQLADFTHATLLECIGSFPQ